MAVHMPAIGSNSNDVGILAPSSPSIGKLPPGSFSDLLAQAADDSLPSKLQPETSALPVKNPASRKTKPTAALPSTPQTKTSASLTEGADEHSMQAKAAAAKSGAASAPNLSTIGVPVTVAPQVPLPILPKFTFPATASSDAKSESLNAEPGKAEAISKIETKANRDAVPAQGLEIEPSRASAIAGSNDDGLLPTALPDFSAAHPSDNSLSDNSLADDASAAIGASGSFKAIDATKAVLAGSNHTAPAFVDPALVTKVRSGNSEISPTADVKPEFRVPATQPNETAGYIGARSQTSQPSTARQVDHNVADVSQGPQQVPQKEKQITSLATEANHAPQVTQPLKENVKEGAKADERQDAQQGARVDLQTSNSDRVTPAGTADRASQSSANDTPNRSGKHESDSAASPARTVNAKLAQSASAISGSDSKADVTGANSSQTAASTAVTSKQDNVPVLAGRDSAQPLDGPNASANKSTGSADHSGSPVAADNLPGTVQSAKLTAQAGHSELRVGLQAGEFGNIDIRTTIARSQVTAEISVEHTELRNLLAAELPHLQTKLAEHSLNGANLVLNSYTSGGSGNPRHAYQKNESVPQGATFRQSEPSVSTVAESQPPSSQLDVHF